MCRENGNGTALKRYFEDPTRVADLLNGYCFRGRQAVRPEDVSDAGPGRSKRSADVAEKIVFGAQFNICGVARQELIDYALPLRVMEHDFHGYHRQQQKLCRGHRQAWRSGRPEDVTEGEYLNAFAREDRLRPVLTLVLFCGEEWDGPRDLQGMVNWAEVPERLWRFFPNYPVNLIEVRRMTHRQLAMYRTDLRQLLTLLHYADDEAMLEELLTEHAAYQNLSRDVLDVLDACLESAGSRAVFGLREIA